VLAAVKALPHRSTTHVELVSCSWNPVTAASAAFGRSPFARSTQIGPRVSRFRHLRERAGHVYGLSPVPGVVRGQKSGHWHFDVVRVAVEAVSVREGKVQRLRDQVRIVEAIVAKTGQVVIGQHLKRLGDHRTLAPWSTGIDLVVPVTAHLGRLHLDLELVEVLHCQQAALLSASTLSHFCWLLTGYTAPEADL